MARAGSNSRPRDYGRIERDRGSRTDRPFSLVLVPRSVFRHGGVSMSFTMGSSVAANLTCRRQLCGLRAAAVRDGCGDRNEKAARMSVDPQPCIRSPLPQQPHALSTNGVHGRAKNVPVGIPSAKRGRVHARNPTGYGQRRWSRMCCPRGMKWSGAGAFSDGAHGRKALPRVAFAQVQGGTVPIIADETDVRSRWTHQHRRPPDCRRP